VILAGLINALKLTNQKKEDVRIVISGVGAAGVATARLLLIYGIKNIIYCDSQGVIHSGRVDLTPEKKELLEGSTAESQEGTLADVIKNANIFIGLSKPGLLTADMVRSMAPKPIIFALANPTPEIMPDEALAAGAFIVATGRSDFPNQVNNSLVFPGAFKGILEANIPQFKIEMFSSIAQALAESVIDLSPQKILPSMFEGRVVTIVSEKIKDIGSVE